MLSPLFLRSGSNYFDNQSVGEKRFSTTERNAGGEKKERASSGERTKFERSARGKRERKGEMAEEGSRKEDVLED